MPLPGPVRGVICAGNAVVDILVRPVDRIHWGGTTWVESIELGPGGNGANTSYTLARLGVPVRLLAWVGADPFGAMLRERLREAGADVSRLVVAREPTAATVGLVRSDGDRSFLHRGGASREAFPEPIAFDFDSGAGYSHFHLANLFGLPRLRLHAAQTLERARAAGLSTSIDTGWDAQGRWMADLEPCLPLADLLFVNESESRYLTGEEDPRSAARILLERGAAMVVTKLGARGCLVSTPEAEFFEPAFEIEAVDTTGAGDCFAGGFLAALHRGCALRETARFANGVGALVTSALGAVSGVRSWDEVQAWMAIARQRAG
jgi:sugar/nucleoside kinase (ribokinase family)